VAHRLGRDLQRAQTDQVAAALAQPKAHKAPVLLRQSQADALLDLVFARGGGHAFCCRTAPVLQLADLSYGRLR
jgi:hypothetical protein